MRPHQHTTNNRPKYTFSFYIFAAVLWLIPTLIVTCALLPIVILFLQTILTPPLDAAGIILIPFAAILASVILSFYIMPIGLLAGKLRAYYRIHSENLQIQLTNPHQYYKELPNSYGIGVASLLADSTLENEKDIVAAILDLCAQGYLHLSKHSTHYVIRILPAPPQKPLLNEAYLLELIHKNQLSKISYQKWYNLCVEDGVHFGLYQKLPQGPSILTLLEDKEKPNAKQRPITVIPYIICSIILFLGALFAEGHELLQTILGVTLFLLIIIPMLFGVIIGLRKTAQRFFHYSYKSTLAARLKKTQKGIDELHKLEAFKAFLAQFSTFVDKNPEAVILWDRYLSYAQVFGLTKEIMRSGYRQLIDNAAFKIDNIDNISFTNLEISLKS